MGLLDEVRITGDGVRAARAALEAAEQAHRAACVAAFEDDEISSADVVTASGFSRALVYRKYRYPAPAAAS